MAQDLRKNPKPPRWSAESARQIAVRVVVEADVILDTPAHLGSGDSPEDTVIPLLVDPYDEISPLLPGASIAGALRAHLLAQQIGYRKIEQTDTDAEKLFGSIHNDTPDDRKLFQSRVIVNDSIGRWDQAVSASDVRRGVKLVRETHTAEDKFLYTHEIWNAGTVFPIHCELLIYETDLEIRPAMISAFVAALNGLADGSIRIGARKQRGFGKLRVETWRVREFDLREPTDLIVWLRLGKENLTKAAGVKTGSELPKLFEDVSAYELDARQMAILKATFAIDGSLLIRQYEADHAVHLTAIHGTVEAPIVSGTSLAGALRSRMHKIAATLHGDETAVKWITELFGTEVDNQREGGIQASRVQVDETLIEGTPPDWVQARVSIDRFTGGALDGALFTEKPIFGVNGVVVTLNLRLINPEPGEIGLLLLALKDLWTGDLPIGGERSIGRGRLQGIKADLTTPDSEWTIEGRNRLQITGKGKTLESYVNEFIPKDAKK